MDGESQESDFGEDIKAGRGVSIGKRERRLRGSREGYRRRGASQEMDRITRQTTKPRGGVEGRGG